MSVRYTVGYIQDNTNMNILFYQQVLLNKQVDIYMAWTCFISQCDKKQKCKTTPYIINDKFCKYHT